MLHGTDAERAEMLVLAALTYRGFSDFVVGALHDGGVRRGVSDGLSNLAWLAGKWELVWGPATSRLGAELDSSCMFVVRHHADRHRYVVAVRGTNPVALSDWLLGDFNVAREVEWPFPPSGARLSTSTAFGLCTLLHLGSAPTGLLEEAEDLAYGEAAATVQTIVGGLETGIRALTGCRLKLSGTPLEQVGSAVTALIGNLATDARLPQLVAARLSRVSKVKPQQLLPAARPPHARPGGPTLFEFLTGEADRSDVPLDVVVTGHSKGGALAPALAVWLKDTRIPAAGHPGWDKTGQAIVGSITFAGPTPGNQAFAHRIDGLTTPAGSPNHLRVANTNDVVTHAWDMHQLGHVWDLYGARGTGLRTLFDAVANDVKARGYAHASVEKLEFAGTTDGDRLLVDELIHQHMDAYLEHFGLMDRKVDALTFFLG